MFGPTPEGVFEFNSSFKKDTSWVEVYQGNVFCESCNHIAVTLKISPDSKKYELIEDFAGMRQQKQTIVQGNLTIKRGFGKDKKAVVYILNSEKASAYRKYFVQLSKSPNELIMLTKERKISRQPGKENQLKKVSNL